MVYCNHFVKLGRNTFQVHKYWHLLTVHPIGGSAAFPAGWKCSKLFGGVFFGGKKMGKLHFAQGLCCKLVTGILRIWGRSHFRSNKNNNFRPPDCQKITVNCSVVRHVMNMWWYGACWAVVGFFRNFRGKNHCSSWIFLGISAWISWSPECFF